MTDGTSVFVYVANRGIYAFDLTGKLLWTRAMEANSIYLDFGTGGAPVLHEDQLMPPRCLVWVRTGVRNEGIRFLEASARKESRMDEGREGVPCSLPGV